MLQKHTEEQPEVVWHQAFWTQCNSPGLPPLACTHTISKCITGKRATSRTACSPQASPQGHFCPCHDNGLPVSHLPPTLQIQTGAAELFQSPLTAAQTKSSLSSRDNHHTYYGVLVTQSSTFPFDMLLKLWNNLVLQWSVYVCHA